jgi:hypothetical protein
MAEVKTLRTDSAVIEFQTNSEDWCQLSLKIGNLNWELGGELFEVLAKKILAFMETVQELPASSPTTENKWKWFLSVSDPNNSFYARKANDSLRILVQDSQAQTIAEFSVDENDVRAWISDLRQWLGDCQQKKDSRQT